MPGRDAQPVAITVIGAARGTTLPFSLDGVTRVAVILKATFGLADGLPMIAAEPQAIAEADVHPDGDASRSLLVASDLVPYRPKADILLSGSAYAPSGAPAPRVQVRLMVGRGTQTLLDKCVLVQGPLGPAGGPAPFVSAPLLWELAARGPANPGGTAAEGWPRILDAWGRAVPVGVGPLPAAWPTRRAFGVAPSVEGGAMRLSNPSSAHDHAQHGFPWDYFQCAPPDQRLEYLQGDEWVVLEGVSPDKPRLRSALPGVKAAVRVAGDPKNPVGEGVRMVADTLQIDAENRLVSIVFRGSFGVESEAQLGKYGVFAKIHSDAPSPQRQGSVAPGTGGPRSRRKYDRVEMKVAPRTDGSFQDTKPPSTKPSPSQTLVGAALTPPTPATPFAAAVKPPSVAPSAPPDLSATPFARARPSELHSTLPIDALRAPTPMPFVAPVATAPAPPLTAKKPGANLNATMSFDPSMLAKVARAHSPMPFAAVSPEPSRGDVDRVPPEIRHEQDRTPSPLPFVAPTRAPSQSSAPPPPPPIVAPIDVLAEDTGAPSTRPNPTSVPPPAVMPFHPTPAEDVVPSPPARVDLPAEPAVDGEEPKLGKAFLAAMKRAKRSHERRL
ncbi:MAG: DUF2169 domain-containing protein [Polyangiaceae bacterium]